MNKTDADWTIFSYRVSMFGMTLYIVATGRVVIKIPFWLQIDIWIDYWKYL